MNKDKQIDEMAKLIHEAENNRCYHLSCRDCKYGDKDDDLCTEKVTAEYLYEAGYSKQEWISVADRLPSQSGRYLVCRCGSSYSAVLDFSARDRLFNALDDLETKWNVAHSINVTHWMPLLQLPAEEGENHD